MQFAATCLSLAFVAAAVHENGANNYIITPLIRAVDYASYLAKFEVGTPAQTEYVKMDTGSPYFALVSPLNNVCRETSQPCKMYGVFDNLTSSTSQPTGQGFSDGLHDFGMGEVLSDTVGLGELRVANVSFGYINQYSFPGNVPRPVKTICGLGLLCRTLNSSCYQQGAFLLPQLYDRGSIDRRAVSFYLGPEEVGVGKAEMIFGGAYDRAKQGGKPFTVPMRANSLAPVTNSVQTTAVTVVVNGTTTRLALENTNVTLLDTGNPLTYLPSPVWDVVYARFGSPSNSSLAGYEVDCGYRQIPVSDTLTIEFGASDWKIDVPLARFVADRGDGTCVATIFSNGPSSNGLSSLGDSFLRSTYVTFDNDKFSVTLAQVKYTMERDIVRLPSI